MRDLSHIDLNPSDFEALAEMCRFDANFPASFGEWTALIADAGRKAQEMALDYAPLALDPEAFKAWCWTVEVVPSVDALRAYAIVCRRRAPTLRS